MTPADIEDAPGKTILVVQGHKPVLWTKPEDITFSATESIPELGCSYNQSFPVLFADGAVRFVNKEFDDKVFRQAILRGDNLPGDLNDLDILSTGHRNQRSWQR